MSETRPRFPVVDLTHSPHVRLHAVPLAAVQLHDTFWEPRIRINRESTLPSQYAHLESTDRMHNFRRASGREGGDFVGIYFNDSDVYKWAEAAAFSLAAHPDPELDATLDAVIADIAAAQQPDGYLNTYFMFEREKERYTNLKDMHELYCGGHLIQAAAAHHRATGKRTFLDVAVKLADHWVELFGPDGKPGACGHEEAEMALVELARDTGEPRYLELAKCMVDARGQGEKGLFGCSEYHQDHLPFVRQTEMTGHAVRHLYLCCGAADILAETGDSAYRDALETLWKNFTERKMYVTGGAGARWEGEAFGADYELPNDRAYAETCAAIGSVMWNWRMLHITGEAKYTDLIETTLYNAVLPGLSLDGKQYFYQNPLADRGSHRRQEWFGCACCPPNVARMLASLPGYFYSIQRGGQDLYTHLYAAGTAEIGAWRVVQKSDYPWNGTIEITIDAVPVGASLFLRIPAWAAGAAAAVNGSAASAPITPGSYAAIPGLKAGDTVTLELPMPIERVTSHPHVLANWQRTALRRGPMVYCIEQADHAGADVWDIGLPQNAELVPEWRGDLLGGVMTLRGEAFGITAIPYYAWANREPGAMQVWLPNER